MTDLARKILAHMTEHLSHCSFEQDILEFVFGGDDLEFADDVAAALKQLEKDGLIWEEGKGYWQIVVEEKAEKQRGLFV